MADQKNLPALGNEAQDRVAATLRALFGAVPFAGGAIAEIVNVVIPNLRADRFAKYLEALAHQIEAQGKRVEGVEQFVANLNPEKLALFEDGATGSAKATSDERIAQLAKLVADGLAGTDRKSEDLRAIVRLLNELTDADIRYLMSWTARYRGDEAWLKENHLYHKHNWDEPGTWEGEAMDGVAEMYIQGRLISMGLLGHRSSGGGWGGGGERELETVMEPQGLDLLRRLGLLGEDEK